MPPNQWAKRAVTVLAGMIDADYQGEIAIVLHTRIKEEYMWNTGSPLGISEYYHAL